jgi:hypothetical protein
MLNNLFKEWEFIKSIKKDYKPCFSDKTFVNMNEWFVTWKRRQKGEMGEKGILYVNNLIDTTIKCYKNNLDINSLRKLKEVLFESIVGLNNLSYTYQVDFQEKVSKDYLKCGEKLQNMIEEIEKIIRSKNNFFTNNSKIITN